MEPHLGRNELGTQAEGRRDLPTTRWSQFVGVHSTSEEARREALGHLFERYKKPIYHYFRLKWKMRPEEAQDLTLEFFSMLLETDTLRKYEPSRASFRTYLKKVLSNFTQDQIDKAKAEKRGGKVHSVSWSEVLSETVPQSLETDPEAALDWSWRMTVLERAIEATRSFFQSVGRADQFRTFEVSVLDSKGEKPADGEVAQQLGLSLTTVRNHLTVARSKLREMVRLELIQTVLDRDQLDEEYRLIIGESGII